jgi:tRNA (guanine26-N2/guanine27-N2)-dimethyltransferase
MYNIVTEGKAAIRIKKADKISREMDVFYNPVMKLNRDISILLLNSVSKNNMQIALPLAGSGIRGIRFLKELHKNKVKSVDFNDYSSKSVNSIKNNLKLNKINKFTIINSNNIKKIINKSYNNIKNNNYNNKKIIIYNNDANLFLLNSTGFDYIDIDPFGSSNLYLEAAIKRISRNGILAVTNTDTAALTGTYPKACVRKYWSMPKRDYMMHETGLRILIRKIQLIGMQYEKALFPVFSYFKDHYFRIFFECVKGKKLCDEIALEHGMFNDAGPLWLGNLWDGKLVNKMYATLLKNYNEKILIKDNELLKFLKIIKEESKINKVGFYDLHDIAKKRKLRIMIRKEELIKKIRKKGFKVSNTHFSGTGVRTDISYNRLLVLLKE